MGFSGLFVFQRTSRFEESNFQEQILVYAYTICQHWQIIISYGIPT